MGGTLHLRYGPEARDLARRKSPTSRIVADEQVVFEDPEVQVVGLFTLADSRLRQIKEGNGILGKTCHLRETGRDEYDRA